MLPCGIDTARWQRNIYFGESLEPGNGIFRVKTGLSERSGAMDEERTPNIVGFMNPPC